MEIFLLRLHLLQKEKYSVKLLEENYILYGVGVQLGVKVGVQLGV